VSVVYTRDKFESNHTKFCFRYLREVPFRMREDIDNNGALQRATLNTSIRFQSDVNLSERMGLRLFQE